MFGIKQCVSLPPRHRAGQRRALVGVHLYLLYFIRIPVEGKEGDYFFYFFGVDVGAHGVSWSLNFLDNKCVEKRRILGHKKRVMGVKTLKSWKSRFFFFFKIAASTTVCYFFFKEKHFFFVAQGREMVKMVMSTYLSQTNRSCFKMSVLMRKHNTMSNKNRVRKPRRIVF